MSLNEIQTAIESLEGFPGNIGMMGGEPTMHPKFYDICNLFQEFIPDKKRRQLWTNGFKWGKHEQIIYETFFKYNILYNDTNNPSLFNYPGVSYVIEPYKFIKDYKSIKISDFKFDVKSGNNYLSNYIGNKYGEYDIGHKTLNVVLEKFERKKIIYN